MVTVTDGNNKRVSVAALIAVKARQPPRPIYLAHYGRSKAKRKGLTEAGYTRILDAAIEDS